MNHILIQGFTIVLTTIKDDSLSGLYCIYIYMIVMVISHIAIKLLLLYNRY